MSASRACLAEKTGRAVCALVGHDFPPPTHNPPEPEYFDLECRRCGTPYRERPGVDGGRQP